MRSLVLVIVVALVGALPQAVALDFPGPNPGPAQATLVDQRLTLENAAIAVVWDVRAGQPALVELADRLAGRTVRIPAAEAFTVTLTDGTSLRASQLRPEGKPTLSRLEPNRQAVRQCLRFGGWQAALELASPDGRVRARWRALLRDQSNYVEQELTLSGAGELLVREVTPLELDLPGAVVAGAVDGSPVVAGNLFLGCEHPMAFSRVEGSRVACRLPRFAPIRSGESWTVRSVMGVVPQGQLRRGFLYYLERQRARPYSPLAYYISWFDIAAPDRKMDEAQCLAVIEAFGTELVKKRGVKLNAFVFDDGWDDNQTLWQFHAGFPRGFAPLREAAGAYGAFVGTWISPWGGYGKAKAERLDYGSKQGFETNRHGFSLAGPNYYGRFRSVCADMLTRYGVKYLKFDGVGAGDDITGPSTEYGPDIEALLHLIADLRAVQPELFVNATVGTWPSPFWLCWSDSTWRSGEDVGFHGPGTTRQQWLTYRDMIARRRRVLRAPLYPLNSLKFQGVMCAPLSLAGKISNDPKDLIDDIHIAAGSGTQLQEFFVRPSMVAPAVWDAMADTIGWMQRNADVLVDAHWIGGDPGEGQVYGFASWSPRKGILVLRNPSERPARWSLDVQVAFELPPGAAQAYRLKPAWRQPGAQVEDKVARAGQPSDFHLAPFAVSAWEAEPAHEHSNAEPDHHAKSGQTQAEAYERFVEEKLQPTYPMTAMRILGECGGIREGICIDLGCGTGHLDVELAKRSKLTIIGLDIDPEMRPFFEKRIREAGLEKRVSFVVGDAQKLPFPDDYADLIVSRGMLIFLPDIAQCLREVDRVLKPTGVAFLGGRYLYAPEKYKMSVEELKKIVADSGVAGAQVIGDRGQWVKIIGPQAPEAARRFQPGPHMFPGRFVADYGITKGECLVLCRGDGPLEQALQQGFLDATDLHLTALYPTRELATTARKRIEQAKLADRITCATGDVHALPLADSSVDAVVSLGAVPFWKDREKAFREIHRVLRPKGVALVGGQYLGMPEAKKVSSQSLRETAARTGIASIRVLDDMGQWVEIRKP